MAHLIDSVLLDRTSLKCSLKKNYSDKMTNDLIAGGSYTWEVFSVTEVKTELVLVRK